MGPHEVLLARLGFPSSGSSDSCQRLLVAVVLWAATEKSFSILIMIIYDDYRYFLSHWENFKLLWPSYLILVNMFELIILCWLENRV